MFSFFDAHARALKKLERIAHMIGELESKFERFSSDELKTLTGVLIKRIEGGESLDEVLPEAFAMVRAAAKQTLGLRHYDVQLMGGMVLHKGKIAEMRTGEGKTLVATLPAYLNALEKKGVHVVTVNDYLAKRDVVWMGQVYAALGLSVGCISHEQAFLYDPTYSSEQADAERDTLGSFKVVREFLRPVSRKEAYAADITYGTNNEFGFDYLRDNLVMRQEEEAQRGHHFAIVDEVDSILIDEARTPLIISMADEESTKLYQQFARVMPHLTDGKDYNVDEKLRAVALTEEGITKVEKILGIENIYDTTIFGESGVRYVHHLEQALRAKALFRRDKDYIVKDGEVIIVDEFTGRMMPGRRYSEGLHQAIEAKEGAAVQRESRTLASISFQNYFRMYKKLSGMTGTAMTSAEEFHKVYKLDVMRIPTHRPMVRKDFDDTIYKTTKGKYQAVAQEIARRHKAGQPVLVGTVSIDKNEHLSALLSREGVKHQVLNAKNHEREAEIIAQAGREGAVTVATNMAGRGVDIILGGNPPDEKEAEKVRNLGGLYVMGTERHEARRIDNQLRGRSGRQGDPGMSMFFISLEDDLARVFGSDKIKKVMDTLGLPEDQPIQNSFVSKAIESAQKKIEGFHFDSRKHLLDYDEVMNKHREVVYKLRWETVHGNPRTQRAEQSLYDGDDTKEKILDIVGRHIQSVIAAHTQEDFSQNWNVKEIGEDMKVIVPLPEGAEAAVAAIVAKELSPDEKRSELDAYFTDLVQDAYEQKEKELGGEAMRQVERMIILRNIDTLWMDHLENMEHMQDAVRLRAWGQQDPLIEYKNEGHRMFKEMLAAFDHNIASTIFKIGARQVSSAPSFANAMEGKPFPVKVGLPAEAPRSGAKVGRNDPCPCGSGKKYKKCHGS
ncbi:preprotein translocase subunit SecA [Candidatus Azambacteria bacterium]|nr:preprotein translocase subunit SecA [Candidatus Azambacteria bacterium]